MHNIYAPNNIIMMCGLRILNYINMGGGNRKQSKKIVGI